MKFSFGLVSEEREIHPLLPPGMDMMEAISHGRNICHIDKTRVCSKCCGVSIDYDYYMS